ncbi:MAG TPA: chromate transporter [Blastocatellia bacterium]|nr:chromate transporter [Blastocatellia bacterium]
MEDNLNEPGAANENMPAWREVFLYFLMLGFINIGGPVAQITMMFNHMVERRAWLSKERFVSIMGFCHMLPGPEALQLAIYVGYIQRGVVAGIAAGVTFIVPGALVMVVLSWLYVEYGSFPQVNDALYVLKPAVLGIIAAGVIKLGNAAIKSAVLGILLVGAFVGMRFAGVNFLLILLIAGVLNLLLVIRPRNLRPTSAPAAMISGGLSVLGSFDGRLFQLAWLFLKTGLFSFGGAYASLVFLQQGAIVIFNVDVARIAAGAIVCGIAYAGVKALL